MNFWFAIDCFSFHIKDIFDIFYMHKKISEVAIKFTINIDIFLLIPKYFLINALVCQIFRYVIQKRSFFLFAIEIIIFVISQIKRNKKILCTIELPTCT